jgi:hypothetical protein
MAGHCANLKNWQLLSHRLQYISIPRSGIVFLRHGHDEIGMEAGCYSMRLISLENNDVEKNDTKEVCRLFSSWPMHVDAHHYKFILLMQLLY